MTHSDIAEIVSRWVDAFVVGMNLCPFAKREVAKQRVRYAVTDSTSTEQLLAALGDELVLLAADDAIETSLLIHPYVLQSFDDYNQFLDIVDDLLTDLNLDGVFQIASFHPRYQFAGTAPDDAENYTNRSPYPLLHILREDSLEHAIATYPDVDEIPGRNTEMMNAMGAQKLRMLMQTCVTGEGIVKSAAL